jgi:recombinational DNA repair protein RecR
MGELIRPEFGRKPKKVGKCNICGDELVGDTCIRCDPPPDFVESVQKELINKELINAEGQRVQIVPRLKICTVCGNPHREDKCPVCIDDAAN